MKLIYRPWGSDPVQNPRGYPPDYPRDSMRIADDAEIPLGWHEISEEYFTSLIQTHYAAVAAINESIASIPEEVDRWKLRAILKERGYFNAIESAFAAIPEPAQGRLREKWIGQETVQRNHPTIVQLGAAIGLTPSQIDDIFRAASSLQ